MPMGLPTRDKICVHRICHAGCLATLPDPWEEVKLRVAAFLKDTNVLIMICRPTYDDVPATFRTTLPLFGHCWLLTIYLWKVPCARHVPDDEIVAHMLLLNATRRKK